MTKTSSQMKNMVEDWIKITNVEYADTTEEIIKKGFDDTSWQFMIKDDVHVTQMKSRIDKIDMHTARVFTKEVTSQLVTGADKIENAVNEINALVTTNGLNINWQVKDGLITGFEIKIDIYSEEFERPFFYHNWDRLVNLTHSVGLTLVRLVNPNFAESQTTSDTSGSTMYQ